MCVTTPETPDIVHAGERPRTRPKTAQIRADQWTGPDELTRELHDARSVKGERITANAALQRVDRWSGASRRA
jgi:hypothetical protein